MAVAACTHDLTYILKEFDNGRLSASMLGLPGLFAQGDSKVDVEKKLETQTVSYFHAFKDMHNLAKTNKLGHSAPKSTLGRPIEICSLTVECPPDAKWAYVQSTNCAHIISYL